MTNDLTKGTIWKKLIIFAIPLLLSSLVQQLYNTVDLIYVGNLLGKNQSSAVGTSSLLITCLVGFFGGMSVGSGVVVSQAFGSKDRAKLRRAVHNTLALSIWGGLLLTVIGWFVAPLYLTLVRTPDEIAPEALTYLRIYFLSFVSIMSYNICSGALRALGDSKNPLIAQAIGGVVNVGMDALFLAVFEDGVAGVAWATLISQTVAAGYVVWRLTKLEGDIALKLKDVRIDKPILKEVLAMGVPAGAQSLLITLSNVMAQYQINGLDVDAIAAFTAYFKVELILYLPIVAFGQATMTFVGQNMGAGNLRRVRIGTRTCLIIAACVTAICSMPALAFGAQLFRIFNKEPEVIALGVQIIGVTFPFYFIYNVLQILGDSIRGTGKTQPPMLIVMINLCIIRTILLFILVPRYPDVRTVALTYPITWATTGASMAVYYLCRHKKLKQASQKQAQMEESAMQSTI